MSSIRIAGSPVRTLLIDNGYDIKTSDRDSGVVATEYRMFASLGGTLGSPAFDFYLQIRVTIRETKEGVLASSGCPCMRNPAELSGDGARRIEMEAALGQPDGTPLRRTPVAAKPQVA